SKEAMLFPNLLGKLIERDKITVWKGISSLLATAARAGVAKSESVKSLSRIVFSGERLPTKYLIEWMHGCPHASFYNAYGPTEATGISLNYRIRRHPASAEEDIPIGRACANMEALLLSCDLKPVPAGTTA